MKVVKWSSGLVLYRVYAEGKGGERSSRLKDV